MATAAVFKHLVQLHEDVEQSANAAATNAERPRNDQERRRGKHRDPPDEAAEHREPPPEQPEGHLLDIKA